ncbi:Peroxiredoxin [Flavobacterium gillisiae]|uniref:Peroxiredoxin n=1 Tax=Flavobacterium gillisiae TaxID=150146 RepID=A0A1H4A952_9FLAO|nr:redoxin domain-containing protein [Flavobacterium gillisiae]SEA32519.1 Peroxiredoxin [Flavobacterium gillisiae]
MKNIQHIILIITLFCANTIQSQEETIGVNWSKTFVEKDFNNTKLYNKKTGIEISKKEFGILVQENPNLSLEKEIDEAGNVTRYMYDPNNLNSYEKRALNATASAKGNFPNFKLTTIDGTQIELSKLNGKIVILRFELFATDFHFKKQEIQELDEKINALENKNAVKAIIVFQCSESDVRKGFDLENSNFELVANGQNFIEKYGISRFPSTLLIDQDGNLIEKYVYSEDITLKDHIKK